jgi:hypothetical protein
MRKPRALRHIGGESLPWASLERTFPAVIVIIRPFLFTGNDVYSSQSRFAGLEFVPENS